MEYYHLTVSIPSQIEIFTSGCHFSTVPVATKYFSEPVKTWKREVHNCKRCLHPHTNENDECAVRFWYSDDLSSIRLCFPLEDEGYPPPLACRCSSFVTVTYQNIQFAFPAAGEAVLFLKTPAKGLTYVECCQLLRSLLECDPSLVRSGASFATASYKTHPNPQLPVMLPHIWESQPGPLEEVIRAPPPSHLSILTLLQ